MTRYDQLLRLASDQRIEARHVALFHAITESWVTDGTPARWAVDHARLIHLSKLKASTYRKTLRELAVWQHIDYNPTTNRHVKTTILFSPTAPESGAVAPRTRSDTGVVRYCHPVTGLAFTTVRLFTALEYGRVNNRTTPVCNPVRLVTAPDSGKLQLIYPARFRHGTGHSSPEEPFSGSSSSAAPTPIHIHPSSTRSLADLKEGDDQGLCVGKRVQGKNRFRPAQTAAARPVSCTFRESPFFDRAVFREAFSHDDGYSSVDLDHYYERLSNWREKSGAEPRRGDWLAMTRMFILNDRKEGKLQTVTHAKPTTAHAHRDRSNPVIPPSATPGRRFGGWK